MDERLFMSHVSKQGDCWVWTGGKTAKGYGRYGKGGKRAHRVAYEHFVGEIPDGKLVCHSCDNRACVNPSHLWVGTNDDNQRDKKAKGRAANNPVSGSAHYLYGKQHSEATRAKLRAAWQRRKGVAA